VGSSRQADIRQGEEVQVGIIVELRDDLSWILSKRG
jgi:hypothetical protein